MNYLLTGASGFLGRHVLQELLFRHPGATVTAVVHAGDPHALSAWMEAHRVPATTVRIVAGDAAREGYGFDEGTLARLRVAPLGVVDCAGLYRLDDTPADPARLEAINVDGPRHLLEALAGVDVRRLVHAGTTESGGQGPGVFDETSAASGGPWHSPYAASKARAEAVLAAEARRNVAICRLGVLVGHTVTGEFKDDGLYAFLPPIERLLGRLPSNVPIPVPGWASVPICPVDHAARALVAILDEPPTEHDPHDLSAAPASSPEIYHVHDPEPHSVSSLFADFLKVAGNGNRTLTLPLARLRGALAAAAPRERAVRDVAHSATRVARELGISTALQARLFSARSYDNHRSCAFLAARGVHCPPLEDYASRLYWTWRGERHRDAVVRIDPAEAAGGARAGHRVLLTGSTSGVGLALARRLAARGQPLLLIYRDADKARATLGELLDAPAVESVRCDLADRESVEAALAEIEARALHPAVIVHAGGVSLCREVTRTADLYGDLDRVFEVNCFAAVRLCTALVPRMLADGFGHIVALSSISAQVDTPRFALYSSAKVAFDQFLRTLKSENIGSGLHVSSVYLPLVDTPMTRPNPSLRQIPMITVEEAVDRVERVLASRAYRSSTSTGNFVSLLDVLSPRLACVTGFLVWKFMAHAPRFAKLLLGSLRSTA